MIHTKLIIPLLGLLAFAACTDKELASMSASNNDLQTTAPQNVGPGFEQTPGIAQSDLGNASDPSSVAYFQQSVGDRVLFAVDKSTLSVDAQVVLDGQAAWLAQNLGYGIRIEGHADQQGTREYNLALGARRANSVRDYLISSGIDANRLSTVSYGKERPVELCSREVCYAKNRRAVMVLLAGLS